MIPRYRRKVTKQLRRSKAKANRKTFTETNVLRLPVKPNQHFVWDAGTGAARGLAVLVNPTGTKTYFVNYRFPGSKKLLYLKLGRIGKITVEEARAAALAARRAAKQGKDPKASDPNKSDAFETVFKNYIEQEQSGRKKNKSAKATEGVVLFNCAELKPRAVATITYREIDALLAGIRDGKNGKPRAATAARLFAHLRDFFGWCARSKIVGEKSDADMPAPSKSTPRDRHYSDDELGHLACGLSALPERRQLCQGSPAARPAQERVGNARWKEFTTTVKGLASRIPPSASR